MTVNLREQLGHWDRRDNRDDWEGKVPEVRNGPSVGEAKGVI